MKPSKLALRFLEWFCPTELYEGIEGDLLEQFDKDALAFGFNKAQWRFRGNVLRFFRLQILSRNHFRIPFIKTAMLKSYFVLGLRNIARHRVAAFINITGISIALTFSILSAFYVKYDYSFDRFNDNYDRIFRVQLETIHQNIPDKESIMNWMPPALKPALAEYVPAVEHSTQFLSLPAQFMAGEIKFTGEVTYVDPEFFKIFTVEFIEGNGASIQTFGNILIDQSAALKTFGSVNVVGKILEVDEELFTVSGVFKDTSPNSSLQFSVLTALGNYSVIKQGNTRWDMFFPFLFVKVADDQSPVTVRQQLNRVIDLKMNQSEPVGSGYSPIIQSLRDVHYDTVHGFKNSINKNYLIILIGLSLVILITAGINYTLISLAMQSKRGVEVGIRKISGASQGSIRWQFFGEMQIIIGVSLPLSVTSAWVLLPLCNQLTGNQLSFTNSFDWNMSAILIGVVFLLGLISAIYPSIVLSRATPQRVLKVNSSEKYRASMGNYLVVFQFTSCIVLMIMVMIMLHQMTYIESKDLGFKGDQIIAIKTNNDAGTDGGIIYNRFKSELTSQPSIRSVSGINAEFGAFIGIISHSDSSGKHSVFASAVESGFFEMIQATLIEGRFFEDRFSDDTIKSYVINETYARELHRDHVIGTPVQEDPKSRIVGVVKDFHFQPLDHAIVPMEFMATNKRSCSFVLVKVSDEDMPKTISLLRDTWQKATGDNKFEYQFLDESIQRWYSQYYRWLTIMSWASGLGIFIASLGMFGLTGLLIVNRTKEIGIRRVLGATTTNILLLLSRRYVILITASFAIAAPIAWHYGNLWLSNFAYHIDLQYAEFIIPVVIVVAMVMLIIVTQSIKTIRKNPTESLRYE